MFSKKLARMILETFFDGRRVVYIALMRSTKTGIKELRGGGYRRVPFSDFVWDDVKGALVNASKIAFPTATSDWEKVEFVAMFDSKTGGSPLLIYPLTHKVKAEAGETVAFLPGHLTITFEEGGEENDDFRDILSLTEIS